MKKYIAQNLVFIALLRLTPKIDKLACQAQGEGILAKARPRVETTPRVSSELLGLCFVDTKRKKNEKLDTPAAFFVLFILCAILIFVIFGL